MTCHVKNGHIEKGMKHKSYFITFYKFSVTVEKMSKNHGISEAVIKRLPRYYRFLGELLKQNIERISSRSLAGKMKLTASQIRQDLNCFGGFGQQGYGYNVSELHREIGKILGVDKMFPTILLGAGNLGKAIAASINFSARGCNLIGIFDIDRELTGKVLAGMNIYHTDELESFCKQYKPTVAVLCTPKATTQATVEQLHNFGVTAFWNFSHYDLTPDYDNAVVENVHLGDSLQTLTYKMNVLSEKENI